MRYSIHSLVNFKSDSIKLISEKSDSHERVEEKINKMARAMFF